MSARTSTTGNGIIKPYGSMYANVSRNYNPLNDNKLKSPSFYSKMMEIKEE
jgi:hypothetical protein